MHRIIMMLFFLSVLSCKQKENKDLTAQQIVDKSIEASGGDLYGKSHISFEFRDKTYILGDESDPRVQKRISVSDSAVIMDVADDRGFRRFVNDSLVSVVDSMATKYVNSINSVHYFAYLPYGLNDDAVNKELMGEMSIKGEEYYKVKVTFDQKGGGVDFEDVYVYWFNKSTYKPDYLAYEFHVDGGGLRFREAYNEREVKGLRFVDYHNYEPVNKSASLYELDSLFAADQLERLSTIDLENIEVSRGSYN